MQVISQTRDTPGANYKQWLPVTLNRYDFFYSSCLDRLGPVITVSGSQTEQYETKSNPLPQNANVDASAATWLHVADYPVVMDGGPDVCFSGGSVWGNYPFSTNWETMHNTIAFTFHTQGKTLIFDVRVHNYGDGISFSRGDPSYLFYMSGVHMTHIRDDCVQNDYMYAGWIDDSLFDGCYTAFSAQTPDSDTAYDGSQNVWTIQNSLIRLKPMEKVYRDRGLIPGHGAFFKWNRDTHTSPRLALYNNVFRVDQPSNSASGLGVPDGKLAGCANNIVVWLGKGAYPDPLPKTWSGKPCFTITTDKAVWDQAVQEWTSQHTRQ